MDRPALPSASSGPRLDGPDKIAPLRSIVALMLREMGSTYGRNPGGYIWAVLEPIGAIVVMAVVFSIVVRSPPIGTSFLLFFATGYLPYSLFGTLMAKVRGALIYSKPLLAYPRVSWIDAVLARFTLTSLTEMTAIMLIWSGIMLFANVHVTLDIRPVLEGLSIVLLTALGVGLVNSLLAGLFPIWNTLWAILSRPLFLGSGVLIMYESTPRFVQDILWWNPLIHAISLVRSGFYASYDASFAAPAYCYGLALILIAFGLLTMRAWHKVILDR